ncbi:MAG TPA: N-acetylmuramoyl-L-alanine amidase [Methylomirabilota bacterium]|jgi:N-acetylmuramoyl-L-alanine amidase
MGRASLAAVVLLFVASTAWAGLPTVSHGGKKYVELARLAPLLKARLEAPAARPQARLITQGRIITLTRNWKSISVNGSPVMLDAPVRVRKGVWLVPESFVELVRPRVISASTAAPSAAPTPAVAAHRMPVALEELRHRSYPSFTRIVVETSGPLTYRVEAPGTKESRVRLLMLAGFPRAQEIADGFIDEVRLERAGDDALLRVVFEGASGDLRVSTLADPPRLVLDFARPTEPAPRQRRESAAPLRVVVLDAGHGGHDTGAIGPGGLQEKDLVLDVTRRVARLLEDKLDVKVLLSRESDQFVTLRDRTTYANRERADLFVSIHANAHRESASAGVETYFLSSEATDGAARQVAALENSVVQLEKTPARPSGRLDAVKAILWDLAQSEFQQESSRLAEVVQDSMTHSLRIPNRGVKQAGFYVLGGAAMPAILIEIGFLTNPKEERRMKDPKYRDEIARAIFAGLAEYKKRYDGRARDVSPNARGARER